VADFLEDTSANRQENGDSAPLQDRFKTGPTLNNLSFIKKSLKIPL